MHRRFVAVVCVLVVGGFATGVAYGIRSADAKASSSLAAFEFHREGATSPEDAAKMLFHGVSLESPSHFVQHLLLGVCDGPIDTLQKFAECLHTTKFYHGDDSFTFYDLRDQRRGFNMKTPLHVLRVLPFDTEDEQVSALALQSIGTYYTEKCAAVDVASEGRDGLQYRSRIVVAQVGGLWYAMPRCKSAISFYEIADKMGKVAKGEEN